MLKRLITVLLLISCAAGAAEPELLEPEKAFRFSARLIDANQVEVRYEIAPGYYLYRDKFRFDADPASITIDGSQLPPGKVKKDEFFGDVQTYRVDLRFILPVKGAGTQAPRFTLKAQSQGCADIGVCYPPQEQTAELVLATFTSAAPNTGLTPFLREKPGAGAPAAAESRLQSEEASIAGLFKGGFWVLIASFFGFGLLLALTPCVFPMIPILSSILVPHGEHLTHARGFALSLAYVLGMAMTYAAAGVAAGLLGTMLSAALQNAWVLAGFAAVFVLLALSMFGFYELQLPNALQSRLTVTSNRLHGGHFASVFTMGILSALIVGPCVAAPLAGALLYISQSGDVVLGGVALFTMGLRQTLTIRSAHLSRIGIASASVAAVNATLIRTTPRSRARLNKSRSAGADDNDSGQLAGSRPASLSIAWNFGSRSSVSAARPARPTVGYQPSP